MRYSIPVQLLEKIKTSDGLGGYEYTYDLKTTVLAYYYGVTQEQKQDFFSEDLVSHTIIIPYYDVKNINFTHFQIDLNILKVVSKQVIKNKMIIKGVEDYGN